MFVVMLVADGLELHLRLRRVQGGAVLSAAISSARAFNHLQTLSFSYFNQNSVGYVHARVMSDTDRIASTLAWSHGRGRVAYRRICVCAIVMMLILNWKLALCVLVIVPVVAISAVYFQKKLVFFHRQVREKNSRITGAFNEGITGATTTKTLVVEDKMEKEFDELTADMKKRQRPRDALPRDLHFHNNACGLSSRSRSSSGAAASSRARA